LAESESIEAFSPEDQRLERAVLGLALAIAPEKLSVETLVEDVAGDITNCEGTQAVYDAISRLIDHGLLHGYGGDVGATKAAVRFDRLGI
jgi:hypothetical protein